MRKLLGIAILAICAVLSGGPVWADMGSITPENRDWVEGGNTQ